MVALETLVLVCALGAAGDTVLLDFSAPWCQPCRSMEPTIHRLSADGYPVRKINIDQERELAQQFRVTAVPCFVLYSGGRETERVTGPVGYGELVKMFQRAGFTLPGSSDAHQGETIRGQSPDRFGQRLRNRMGEMLSGLRGGGETADASVEVEPLDVDVPFPEQSMPQPQQTIGRPPDVVPNPRQHDRTDDTSSPRDRALGSTVRLTVETQSFKDVATGTIIDVHGEEALIITCGHVFRDSAGKGKITVEFCGLPSARPVVGQLITYDASRRDIGLVAIRPGVAVTPVPVAPEGFSVHERMAVFSIGCDHGGPASVIDSRVSGINRYLGPPNIEISGEPVQGRSGGGLFTSEGLLIGICNCADHGSNEGIYGALSTIHQQLAQMGLKRLIDDQHGAAQPIARRDEREDSESSAEPLLPALPPVMPTTQPFAAGAAPPESRANATDVEVIFIVRSRGGNGQANAVTIKNPSRELLQMMHRESQYHDASNVAREPAASPPGAPIVRAQSQQ